MLIIGIYGPSNSGKTTLIEVICRELGGEYGIAVIKHAPDHNELDVSGKDSHRYIVSGAEAALVSGDGASLLSIPSSLPLDRCLGLLRYIGTWDLILVEGFTDSNIPRIKVGEGEERRGTMLLHQDEKGTVEFVREKLQNASSQPRVELEIDGKALPLSGFPLQVIENTVNGLVSTLKGGERGEIRLVVRRSQ